MGSPSSVDGGSTPGRERLRRGKKYTALGSAQGAEGFAELGGEQLRLLPGREVPALGEPVVVNQVGVGFLGPAARGGVDLVGEDAHGGGERDPLGGEEGELALPVQPRRRDR